MNQILSLFFYYYYYFNSVTCVLFLAILLGDGVTPMDGPGPACVHRWMHAFVSYAIRSFRSDSFFQYLLRRAGFAACLIALRPRPDPASSVRFVSLCVSLGSVRFTIRPIFFSLSAVLLRPGHRGFFSLLSRPWPGVSRRFSIRLWFSAILVLWRVGSTDRASFENCVSFARDLSAN